MIKLFKTIREMLKDSRYLATMKEQNDLLRATLEKEREQKVETEQEKYQKRKQNYLRPVNEMKDFVRSHYEVRHNVVTDVYEYRRRADGPEAPFVMIDKRQFNTIANEVEGADIFCLDSFVRRNLECDFAYDYHPVTDYLNKVRGQWDGQDRVDELLRRISQDDYCLRMGRVWLRAVVAQWLHYDLDHANAVMLLLVSERQGMHKSTFVKNLLPPCLRDRYTDDFSLATKGNAQRKMVEFAIINMDEFDKMPVKKMPELKSMMQSLKPSFIGAYKKSFNQLPRIASFVGTSNERQLLTDRTGSRRFLILEPDDVIRTDQIDYDQLYAQLVSEVEHGAQYFFTKDMEQEMQQRNQQYYRLEPVEELISTFFRKAKDGEEPREMGSAQMIKLLERHNHKLMNQMSQSVFGKHMRRLGFSAHHTEQGNLYRVIER